MSAALDPTHRFSNRVKDYVLYRPGYPPGVVEILAARAGLTPESVIADIGSGTGILTRLFLDHGCELFAVEPNREMRSAAQVALEGQPRFHSIDGRAEATGLESSSVDFVVAGQAFHWFERAAAHDEFARILRPGGWVVLIWNQRLSDATRFAAAYEDLLLTYGTDYREVGHRNTVTLEELTPFFAEGALLREQLPNQQSLDWQGLKGRLLSSSYTPAPGAPRHEEMIADLEGIFQRYQRDGSVRFDYRTEVYFGRLQS
ncbi:MAG TPA: class I SAM-dependent methyltransferase [Thermoanaerobaculia bacterium]|nr:class I SAM-dependent methyltransferase [Thermoanaerobaculia bacterium]